MKKAVRRLASAIETMDHPATSPEAAASEIVTDAIMIASGRGGRREVERLVRNGAALSSSVSRVRAEVAAAVRYLRSQRGE